MLSKADPHFLQKFLEKFAEGADVGKATSDANNRQMVSEGNP